MKIDRAAVYEKHDGHCAYCGRKIEYKDMQVDHILPQELVGSFMVGTKPLTDDYELIEKKAYDSVRETKDPNHPDNLLPACRQCNFYKSTFRINAFRGNIEETLWHKLEKDFNYRLLTKYGCIEEHRKPIIFYFEKQE